MRKIIIFIILTFSISYTYTDENYVVNWVDGKIYSSAEVSVKAEADYASKRLCALNYAKELARVNYYRALKSIKLSDNGTNLYEYFDSIGERKSMLFSLIDSSILYKLENKSFNDIKVTYYINIYGKKNSLMNIIMGENKHYTEDLLPYIDYNYESDFTGIIIDARGELTSFDDYTVKVVPAMFISIRDSEGNKVFDRYNVLSSVIESEGMVRYLCDIKDSDPKRIGNKPLKIVAFGTGDRSGSVLVVSTNDAKRMLSSTATRNAIKNGKIEIIINKQ